MKRNPSRRNPLPYGVCQNSKFLVSTRRLHCVYKLYYSDRQASTVGAPGNPPFPFLSFPFLSLFLFSLPFLFPFLSYELFSFLFRSFFSFLFAFLFLCSSSTNYFSPFVFGLFSYPPIEIAIDRMSKEETSFPFPFCHMPFPCISFHFLYLFLLIFSFAFLFLSHFGAYLTIWSKEEISSPFPSSHFVWSSIFLFLNSFISFYCIINHVATCEPHIQMHHMALAMCHSLRLPCGIP